GAECLSGGGGVGRQRLADRVRRLVPAAHGQPVPHALGPRATVAVRGRDGDVEILGALAVPRIAELTPDVVAELGVELVAAALVPEDQGRVVSGDLRGDA